MFIGMEGLLTSKKTFSEYAKSRGLSRVTVSRYLHECIDKISLNPPDPTGEVYDCVVVDATWLRNGGTVAIAVAKGKVQQWVFSTRDEGINIWLAVFSKIPKPGCIVCDGHKGLIAAAKRTYGEDIRIQRCLFHLHNSMKSYLKPKTTKDKAAIELWELFRTITTIKTVNSARNFEKHFQELYSRHREHVDEHTMMTTPTNQVMPNYTHRNLHAGYALIDNLIKDKQLFNYLDHKDLGIPNTTNDLEGGINSRINELLRCHRGLTFSGQMWLVNFYLWTRTEQAKPPFKLKQNPNEKPRDYQLLKSPLRPRPRRRNIKRK